MATILLVEDDKPSLNHVVALLQKKSHLVLPARCAREAWDWIEEYVTLDIIFLDSDLGDEKGWDFLSALRQNIVLAGIPVVVCTAHSEKREVLRYLDLKVQHYLVKPYDIFKLDREIERAIAYNWPLQLFEDYHTVCSQYNITQKEYLDCLRTTTREIEAAHGQLQADAITGHFEEIAQYLANLRARTERSGFIALENVLLAIEAAAYRQDQDEARSYLSFFPALLKILDTRTQGLYGVSLLSA